MKICEEKNKNKGVACPLAPFANSMAKLEVIQSLPLEPPRREGGNLNRENPEPKFREGVEEWSRWRRGPTLF
jgi:hypothetical protein